VKGITYSLQSFLGPLTWDYFKKPQEDYEYDVSDYQKTLLTNKDKIGTALYHCVIYLAPGDYHRFHSPAQWNINYRRHFPGKLLSVRPTFASWFPNLFNVNERVIYMGQWNYGFFSMAAVGATNVGSVKVYFDEVNQNCNNISLNIFNFIFILSLNRI
jgi:phosphatidylserine decarboxylase